MRLWSSLAVTILLCPSTLPAQQDTAVEIHALREEVRILRQELSGQLQSYHTEVVRLWERYENTRETVAEHELILQGPPENGERPGLVGRLQAVEWYQNVHVAIIGAIAVGIVLPLLKRTIFDRLWKNSKGRG